MFQVIDRFAQTKNIMRLRLINEAGELRHKDFFMEMAMKEGVVDIKLCTGQLRERVIERIVLMVVRLITRLNVS